MGVIGMSLCSGIGAPEMAAPWIDWRLASEIEAFPRAVLQHRFGYRTPTDHNQGDPMLWADMTEVTSEMLRQRGIPLPEIIVAGTPCQAFSVAGLRQGLEDPRGNLTLAFVEILHAIVAARSDGKLIAVWENVPGVLSDNGNAFGCFLGGLVGAVDALRPPGDGSWPGEGMVQGPRARAAWCILDAQWFGVAQRRRRVFVVVDFGGAVDPAAVLLEPDRLRGDSPPRRKAGQGTAAGVIKGAAIGRKPENGPQFGDTLTDGSCYTLTCNEVHATIASTGHLSHCLNAGGMGRQDYETETMVAHSLRGEGFDASEDGTGRGTPMVPVSFGAQNAAAQGDGVCNDFVAALDKSKTPAVAFAIQERAVSENPDAGPDGAGFRQDGAAYTMEARPVTQAVAFGCGVDTTGHQGDKAFAPGDVWTTLSAQSGNNGGGGGGILSLPWAVRRLIPVETARLQGFPDDHTAITYRGKPAADGPQYKALGNSMAVPVMRWILDRVRISATAHRKPQPQSLFDGAAE
jgi:DNA (cytosine-5)-methyltransferase 1